MRVDPGDLVRSGGGYRRRGVGLRAHRRVVMDERHRGHEAQRVDAGGVREPRGCVDERQRSDRNAVEAQEIKGLQGAIDVRGADERRERLLHLHDDRQKPLRIGRHQGEQRRVDLVLDERWRDRRRRRGHDHGRQRGQLRARRGRRGYKRKRERDERAGGAERAALHARSSTGRPAPRFSRKGRVKQNVLPWP
jgi:hypothetical protein